jgi:hypothetical protein
VQLVELGHANAHSPIYGLCLFEALNMLASNNTVRGAASWMVRFFDARKIQNEAGIIVIDTFDFAPHRSRRRGVSIGN